MSDCKKCGSRYVVNKHFCLCRDCNNERLHGSKYGKQPSSPLSTRKSLRKPKKHQKRGLSEKAICQIQKDEETYEEVFNKSNHRCEECGCGLNTEFRDDEGRVMNRARYAHILPKSIYPDMRNNPDNFFDLCFKHHSQFDHGDKFSMKIYKKYESFYEKYLESKNN